jgi:hypothetical protein
MRTTPKSHVPTPPAPLERGIPDSRASSPTTAARDAAQIVLGLVERLAPTADRPGFRTRLHVAAQTLQRALDAGASIHEVLNHLITATAPPIEPPPYEPWAPILSMTFDEFAESGVGLHVVLPKLGEGIWLVGDEVTQTRVVEATRLWNRYVKLPGWMTEEADRLRLPTAERTVGRFIAALDGVVIGWRGPTEAAR